MTAAPRSHVVVMTGAGISADSGLRTFRDTGGLWEGVNPEEVATPEAWARHRDVVWRFYQLRRAQLATVQPNAAHEALATFARRCNRGGVAFTLVTQNVDDLHERAGSEPVHMHGELARLRCEVCSLRIVDRDRVDPEVYVPCAECGHDAMRPDIVWFGEVPLHLDVIQLALSSVTHFLAVGTSGVVWPAAGMLGAARNRGAKTWVQALEAPENVDRRDDFRAGRAAVVLPPLLDEIAALLRLPPLGG